MTFADKILRFHQDLNPDWTVPKGVEILFPFSNQETWAVMSAFFKKYFDDEQQRTLIMGINPGRFGAGITGTPFTDPKKLEQICGIPNNFKKRGELSADFVYEFINGFGGPEHFYQYFYITSVCPLGFVKDGKNYNYYDDKALEKAVEPHIIDNVKTHLAYGCNPKAVICMGQGKNYKYFKKLNEQHQFFEKVIPLPHPRWVMQYRRKRMEEFRDKYVETLQGVLQL
jgi:uracil-DNA glycosylase